jgi:hypothetical protein
MGHVRMHEGTSAAMPDGAHNRKPAEVIDARCERCGETFMPADPSDLMHFQRRDGELCGGDGVTFRKYVIRNPNRD